MKTHVTVVPSDHLIIVDGQICVFDYPAPSNLHAIQWHDGKGEIEWTDDINHPLTLMDYEEDVAPFVRLFEEEQTRLKQESLKREALQLIEYNSNSARAERIRTKRNDLLHACSWIIERHRDQLDNGENTTLTHEKYQEWLNYRQALRDLPNQSGFPWLGGGDDDPTCPWPIVP